MILAIRSVLITLVALGVLALGGSADALAAAKLTVKPKAATVSSGNVLALNGTLSGVRKKAKQTIVLQADVAPLDGKFKPAGTTRTDKKGKFRFTVAPTSTTVFRAMAKKV